MIHNLYKPCGLTASRLSRNWALRDDMRTRKGEDRVSVIVRRRCFPAVIVVLCVHLMLIVSRLAYVRLLAFRVPCVVCLLPLHNCLHCLQHGKLCKSKVLTSTEQRRRANTTVYNAGKLCKGKGHSTDDSNHCTHNSIS